ncbi:MAG: hypothetical protein CM15mP3_09690 [Candidatus Poseidoniales archaeon]|nr:MAG: hypothetical protein CM15mP3_09690 [Candidatus Poseidoniales archaeon]
MVGAPEISCPSSTKSRWQGRWKSTAPDNAERVDEGRYNLELFDGKGCPVDSVTMCYMDIVVSIHCDCGIQTGSFSWVNIYSFFDP